MKMVYMSVVPTFAKRSVSRLSTLRHLPQRQTENEIVESIPSTHENLASSRLPRRRSPIQTVNERSSIPIRGAVFSSIPECEIMFRIPNHHEPMFRPRNPVTRDRSVQKLGENFVHMMESFKRRGSKRGLKSREPFLGMYQYAHRLDHRFVSSVLEMKVDIDAKITFFSWSGQTRRDYQHNYSTYTAFIQVLEEEARLATRLSDWVYPFLLGLYLKLFKVEKALVLLEEMEQTPGSSPTYYSDYMELIKEFVRVGKVTPHIEVQQYYDPPKYYIFGGLVFVPFSKAYMENIGDKLSKCVLLCATETKAKDLEAGELVMLSRILRHDTNHSCDHLENLQVYKVNGVKVNSLKHLVELIEQCCMEYLTLDLQGGYVAELHYSSAKEAASEIMELYRIFYSKSKNLSD